MSETRLPSMQALLTAMILATVFHALALMLTSFRLWFRYHTRRLWWDDFWAALALLCDAVCVVGMWIYSTPLNEPNATFGGLSDIHAQSRSAHIIFFWLNVLTFTCVIWFARISIVFSVVRIVSPSRSTIIAIFGAGAAFICMWIYVFICKVVVCSVDKSWYYSPSIECHIPRWVALSEVCTDVLSDIVLVILPLYLLWSVKLPTNQKFMVLSIFSTSIFVTVVSVVHTVYLICNVNFIVGVTAQIEGAVSLIVCNLLVIVTFLYRVITQGEHLAAGPSSANAKCSNYLTTVDLNVSGGSLLTSTLGAGTSTGFVETHVSSDGGILPSSTAAMDAPASVPSATTPGTDPSHGGVRDFSHTLSPC